MVLKDQSLMEEATQIELKGLPNRKSGMKQLAKKKCMTEKPALAEGNRMNCGSSVAVGEGDGEGTNFGVGVGVGAGPPDPSPAQPLTRTADASTA